MATKDKVNDMRPIRLHPNKAKLLAAAIFSLAIAIGIVVVCIRIEIYVFLVFAGFLFVYSGFLFSIMRRNVIFLDLSPAALEEGFPGNNRRWKWSYFDYFFVVDVSIQSENAGTEECVGFLYSSSYDGAKPSKPLASPPCDDTLIDLYGMKAPELADLLNQWRSCKNTG